MSTNRFTATGWTGIIVDSRSLFLNRYIFSADTAAIGMKILFDQR
jgi:hypothetical protein